MKDSKIPQLSLELEMNRSESLRGCQYLSHEGLSTNFEHLVPRNIRSSSQEDTLIDSSGCVYFPEV
jgi:hypothetical protein